MELTAIIVEFFLYSVGLGVCFFSLLADPQKTGGGFLRLTSSVTMASSLLAVIFHISYASYESYQAILYYVIFISSTLSYVFQREKRNLFMIALYVVQILSFLMILNMAQNGYMIAFSLFLSSALFLGVITYSMIMGHWYLVTPKLSERPLLYSMVIMWILLLVKLSVSVYYYMENPKFFEWGTSLGGGSSFNWMMLLMRIVWGYVVVGIMSVFSWRLIRMRSIQSATGILYAMTFFVFIGEIISVYFYYKFGMLL